MRNRKIIVSRKRKGYNVARIKGMPKTNILFLINKLSSYKLYTYQSFINSIGANVNTNLQIYHCDESLFLSLVEKYKSAFDYYVIMPHFKTDDLKHDSFAEAVINP